MGLAPYGNNLYSKIIEDNLIAIYQDGFKLNMEYFDYCIKPKMIGKKFEDLFKIKKEKP